MRWLDRDGLEELYAAHYPRLVAELTVVSGSRAVAEDCANEAFTRLVLHWNKVSQHDHPAAWLRTVGYRLAVDEYRRTRRHAPFVDLKDDPRTAADPPRNHEIWQAVLDLPTHQREVMVRRAAQSLTDAEIADDLDLPVGTVKSRLSRARATLRSRLGELP